MTGTQEELRKLTKEVSEFHIPRWEELPDLELYMEQVITYIENNLFISSSSDNDKIITPSMVNNYVKLNLIPRPIQKKYNKTHLAYLIAISILKHVFTIQEVKDGIIFQAELCGEKDAYNLFCQEQENALKYLANQINLKEGNQVPSMEISPENLTIKMATLAFASKIIGSKVIGIQKSFMENKTNK